MSSIEIEVALVVLQLNCAWSPAEITIGVAVICAVGAPAEVTGAAVSDVGSGGAVFLPQPAMAKSATQRKTGTKNRLRTFMGDSFLSGKATALFFNLATDTGCPWSRF
jgi:hypothetical protein